MKKNGKNGAQPPRMADPVFRRRLAIRGALVALLVALGAFSMIVGRGHTIVLDDMKSKDGAYEAVRMLSARIGHGKEIELSTGVRELVTVSGQRHKLVVDWMDGQAPLEQEISIPFGQDFVIVYLPKLKAGMDGWVEPFFPYANPAPAEAPAAAPADPSAAMKP
jgi:hypothetical protein